MAFKIHKFFNLEIFELGVFEFLEALAPLWTDIKNWLLWHQKVSSILADKFL